LEITDQTIDMVSAQWIIRKISHPENKGNDLIYRVFNKSCVSQSKNNFTKSKSVIP
jgi:hypothetical protein